MIAAMLLLLASPQAAPVVAPAPQVDADMSARMAKARTIVERSMPAGQRDQMFGQMLDGLMANMLSGMMQGDPTLKELFETNSEAARLFARNQARQTGELRRLADELTPLIGKAR
ncbi:hypothetical protein [Sphingomonas koreensis]